MNHHRQLTPIETAMELLNHSSASFNVLTISKIKGNLNPETLQKSLELLQQRHLRLNSRIVGDLNNLYFTNDQSQKILLKTIKFQDQDQLQQIIKSELNQKIDREKILFRTIFIQSDNHHNEHYFITLIHHAIIDALSSVRLHSEIFTYCDRITQGEKINIQTLPVLPPIHDLFPPQLQGIKGTIKHN
ncbi:MAG TPA: condensation domain-containing protein, partial [Allocoleopsis sp.]